MSILEKLKVKKNVSTKERFFAKFKQEDFDSFYLTIKSVCDKLQTNWDECIHGCISDEIIRNLVGDIAEIKIEEIPFVQKVFANRSDYNTTEYFSRTIFQELKCTNNCATRRRIVSMMYKYLLDIFEENEEKVEQEAQVNSQTININNNCIDDAQTQQSLQMISNGNTVGEYVDFVNRLMIALGVDKINTIDKDGNPIQVIDFDYLAKNVQWIFTEFNNRGIQIQQLQNALLAQQ